MGGLALDLRLSISFYTFNEDAANATNEKDWLG
jgi:hypothetical protein